MPGICWACWRPTRCSESSSPGPSGTVHKPVVNGRVRPHLQFTRSFPDPAGTHFLRCHWDMNTTFSRIGGAVGTKGTAPEHRVSDACASLVQPNRAALRLQPRFCPVLDCIPSCPAETLDLLLSYLTNMSTSQLRGWPDSLEGAFLAGCRVWWGVSSDQDQGQLFPA